MPAMSAGVLVTCRICNHEFIVPEQAQGRSVVCPHCRNALEVVPEGAQEPTRDKLVGRGIGGCRLVRRLGAGAMGYVYEAERLEDGLRVAVKLLAPKAAADEVLVKRFRREARLAATIEHPNVTGVYGFGYEKKVHYLVMEYVDGDTLDRIIQEAGRLPWREAAGYVLQIARGLERLAAEAIIHRDVKPANVLVSADGVAKLADLGLAKQDASGGSMSLVTMAGAVMGSPSYMAPEQARDSTDVTPASDVYSLGATFYHAVTGRPPFSGRNAMRVLREVLTDPVVPPRELTPELPVGVDGLILDLLAKDPQARPQDMSETITAVEAVLAAPERLHRAGPSRFPWSLVLLALTAAAVLGLAAYYLIPW